jgi:peptide/nickel transport system substrate-binding protein
MLAPCLVIIAAACSPRPSSSTIPQPGDPEPASGRTLVIAVRAEPPTLVEAGLDPIKTVSGFSAPTSLFHAGLTQEDEKLIPHPYLAKALPQLGTDTWKVFPDGRMETTWRLRPNLTWHDGAPLVADDFVLSIQGRIALKTAGASGKDGVTLARLIEEIHAPDARTVVVGWKTLFPGANETPWQPLPRHLLGSAFADLSAPESVAHLPYWNAEFVGVGPYRLERWERGVFIEGTAFGGYVHGLPRIPRIQLVWISDKNTAVAQLLSGAIGLTADGTIGFEQAMVLQREWAARADPGTVVLSPDNIRFVLVQYRTEYTNPSALLDVRVRQAFAHAIDKQNLVDGMVDGQPAMAFTGLSPQAAYYPELDRVLTKYPYDLRRAEQLMTDAGFAKDREGFFAQHETRLSAEIRATTDGMGDREAPILADSWKRAGMETPLRMLTAAEGQNGELRSAFPAFSTVYSTTLVGSIVTEKFPTKYMATAGNGWTGVNRSGYSHPEYDRLYDIVATTLDVTERNRARVQAEKLLSDQAAYFPLYYFYSVIAHAGDLVGPRSAY